MRRLVAVLMFGVVGLAAGAVNAAPPAPYVNILKNGNFGSSFSEWVRGGSAAWDVIAGAMYIHSPTTNNGGILQDTGYSASTADRYEVQLEIGNTSAAAKDVVLIVGTTDGSNLVSCQWTIPPDTALRPYRMQTLAPGAWANIRFIFRVTTQDSLPAVTVDNLHLFYSPSALNSTTICAEPPAPTPTPTPTPQLYTEFEISEGNAARVDHVVSAGDYTIIILLFVLLVSGWGVFILRELRGEKP